MKRFITIPLAFGIVLVGATAAFAAASPNGAVHQHRATNPWTLADFFDPSGAPTVSAKASAHARHLRHEGLSRRRGDCMKYGCLGY